MRHQKAGRKLGRTTSHRNAMFRNMLASFFEREKIETTTVKAKELRPLAEKLITLGKRGDLHSRRRVLRLIPDRKVVHKLFNEIASRFESRVGGYTRIIRIGYRAGDNAPMSIIELVTDETVTGKKKGKKKKKIPAQAKPEVKTEAVEATTPEKEKVPKGLSLEKSVEEKQAGDKGGEESPQVQKNTPSVSEEKESGGEGSGSEATSGDESRESSEKTE